MAGTRAGQRDRRIDFHRAVTTTDRYNQEIATWGLLGKAWAAIRWGSGAERREAASTSAPQSATFIVLANAVTRSLDVRDRIYFDGSAWDIGGIAEVGGGQIEITAVRDASAADPLLAPLDPLSIGGAGLSMVGGDLRLDVEELTQAP